jgi:IS30 family transposase
MDIVDMQRSPVESTGNTYKYVLVFLDVCSRFIFLRPLQSKSSAEVATHVVQLFSDIGPPRIVQTDQGTEFKGVVEKVMEKFKIHIIHSRPYHPQSQGKVCGIYWCMTLHDDIMRFLLD